MPLPVAALGVLAGGLLGGSTQQNQTTTVSSSNSNSFSPSIVFGGDSNFTPISPVTNDFQAATTTSQTQEQPDAGDLLSAFNPLPQIPITGASATLPNPIDLGLSSLDLGTNAQAGVPLPFLIGGAVILGGIAILGFSNNRDEA